MIAIATYPYYYVRKISGSERIIAAVQIALPGMIMDILSIIYFAKVFPNLTNDSLPIFASWLLWAYSLILLTGFSSRIRNKIPCFYDPFKYGKPIETGHKCLF
ncbi:DUF5367 family protein [Cytobacillus sp. NJ13]|nr:DUF5367 family protein [Cytobacillus sp. NJ13]